MGKASLLKKRAMLLIERYESSKLKNNYFIFWKGKEEKDIPDKSLVIILTEYEKEDKDQWTPLK